MIPTQNDLRHYLFHFTFVTFQGHIEDVIMELLNIEKKHKYFQFFFFFGLKLNSFYSITCSALVSSKEWKSRRLNENEIKNRAKNYLNAKSESSIQYNIISILSFSNDF